jgi:predicted DNA-binding transcriptional regulator AlpA
MLHLSRLPRAGELPSFKQMMDEGGSVKPRDLAKALGVSERQVFRWIKSGTAPKPVVLALFWVTRWGLQWTDAEVFNLAQLHMGMSDALRGELARATKEIEALRAQVQHLGRLGDFGAANDPVQGVAGPGPDNTLRLTFSQFEQLAEPSCKPAAKWAKRRRDAA